MKVKVKKSELYECVKNAVVRAINEAQGGTVNEDFVDDFIKNNPIPKASKGEMSKAKKAAERDIETSSDSEDGDEEKAEKQPDSKKPKRGPAKRFVPSRFRQ